MEKIVELIIKSEVVKQKHYCPDVEMPVLRQSFRSRKADFVLKTCEYESLPNHAVSFRVGPIGLEINAEEAEALGRALIASANHYKQECAKVLDRKLSRIDEMPNG